MRLRSTEMAPACPSPTPQRPSRAPSPGGCASLAARHLLAGLLAALTTACPTPTPASGKDDPAKDEAADGGEAAPAGEEDASAEGPRLGRFDDDGPVPWTKLLLKTPEEVEAVLGEATDRGSGRVTCVRFLPERTFFSCRHEVRLYALEGFESVAVDYEDGKAANVAVVGFTAGEQDVTPQAALELAGLELPVPGRKHELDGDASVWEWFNSLARLKIGEAQFMVRLSTMEGDWKRTKLEVIANNPLSEDERTRVTATGTPGDGASGGTDAPAPAGPGGDPSRPETVLRPVD